MTSELREKAKIQAGVRQSGFSSEIIMDGKVAGEEESLADNIVMFLGKIVSLKSPYTADHSKNVKNLTLELALRVGFQVDKLKSLGHAAMLHDIGKIVISENVTDKPSQFSEAEYLRMKQHVLLGYQIIQPLDLDPLIGDVVLYHHESYDGSGYLAGLRGDEIPLAARIVKITDTYDALTSARPYRAAYSHAQAIELLKEERRHFDPFLLDEFLELLGAIPLARAPIRYDLQQRNHLASRNRKARNTMNIEYRSQAPTKEQFSALFETTGWNRGYRATPEELILAVTNSQFVIAAYDDEKLVGFGRVVTDGVLHAMIYDMIIHPSYQSQGIGTRILTSLVSKCREANIRDIQLFCALGKRQFYEKGGFGVRPVDAPGMQYSQKPSRNI